MQRYFNNFINIYTCYIPNLWIEKEIRFVLWRTGIKRPPVGVQAGDIHINRLQKAGEAEEELGGVVGDHDDPVDGMAGSEEKTGKDHDVADEEECAADGDQLALERVEGKTGNGTG